MNTDQSAPPSHQAAAPAGASATSLHSNRSSPFLPAPTTTSTKGDMTAASFNPGPQALRPPPSSSSPYPLNLSPAHLFERELAKPIGAPFSPSPAISVRVIIRRLPPYTTEESLRSMVVWSKELVNVELLPLEQSEDEGFRAALLFFRSMAGALEAKHMLDGRSNISNDAEMIVTVLTPPPNTSRRLPVEPQPPPPPIATAPPPADASGAAPGPGPRRPSRFNSVFPPVEPTSPTSQTAFPSLDFLSTDPGAHYQTIFSPQSPIGNHLASDRSRISGKALISNDLVDDEETSEMLKDPVAYAENGATSRRRATAPQIPVNRMAGLSLHAGNPSGPSSLPPYMGPLPAANGPMPNANGPMPNANGPMPNANGPATASAYPAGNPGYPRHTFPPVNPADQNPPCNTLYVGNLPLDTSEEELKAMFSKQRGYKRLCFRTKQNGPMCFVEFEDISFATKALHELYGHPLHNSVKGGIRLSFSKNPLGVRSVPASAQGSAAASMGSMGPTGAINSGVMAGSAAGFSSAQGPPPGLAAPPGLGAGRGNYNLAPASNNPGGKPQPPQQPQQVTANPAAPGQAWSPPIYNNNMAAGSSATLQATTPAYMPRHMMGR